VSITFTIIALRWSLHKSCPINMTQKSWSVGKVGQCSPVLTIASYSWFPPHCAPLVCNSKPGQHAYHCLLSYLTPTVISLPCMASVFACYSCNYSQIALESMLLPLQTVNSHMQNVTVVHCSY